MDLDRVDVRLAIVEIAYVRRRNHKCIIGLYSEGCRILTKLEKKGFFFSVVK